MLANLNDVLRPARRGGYAVGLFNTVNFEMARGVLAAGHHRHGGDTSSRWASGGADRYASPDGKARVGPRRSPL